MSTIAPAPSFAATRGQRGIALAGLPVLLIILVAMARRATTGPLLPPGASLWLILHLATVVPALPLGAFVLARTKGDRLHRISGRIWAGLMIVAALSSFGLTNLMGRIGPIHLLSVLTLIGVPRAILAARAGRIAAHRRAMLIVYASMVIAGLFTFIPGRLLGNMLFD